MKFKKVDAQGKYKLLPGIFLLCVLFSLFSCAHWFGFPSYYDPTTYKNLTDLKPEVAMLYETFTSAQVDSQQVNKIRLKLAQIYEYEKGKGEDNQETTQQIKIIREMFVRHLEDRLQNGKWSSVHLENVLQNMDQAFDLTIQTERLKNKNE